MTQDHGAGLQPQHSGAEAGGPLLELSLDHKASSRITKAAQRNPVLNPQITETAQDMEGLGSKDRYGWPH